MAIDFVAFIAFAMLFIYFLMGLGAYHNQADSDANVKRYDKSWVISPVWCFYPSAYNEEGRKLCKRARVFFFLGNGMTLCWALLDGILR